MNSGNFKHRITIFKELSGEDDDGFPLNSHENKCSIWCAIKTVNGNEYYAAAQTQHENTYRFIIRYREGISPYYKVDFKGRIFDIESVLNDDERKKTLTIIAKERV